ncbi:30S ribosomal protein S15 [Candidatus Vidania fulgoroideorum]
MIKKINERIKKLKNHFLIHKKDFSSMRGLKKIINIKKKYLKYKKKKKPMW